MRKAALLCIFVIVAQAICGAVAIQLGGNYQHASGFFTVGYLTCLFVEFIVLKTQGGAS